MSDDSVQMIEEFVADFIARNKGAPPKAAMVAAVTEFPAASALAAVFAFVTVASALERPIIKFSDDPDAFVRDMYRSIAAFVADIYAVSATGNQAPTCSHIREFWLFSEDTFFVAANGS